MKTFDKVPTQQFWEAIEHNAQMGQRHVNWVEVCGSPCLTGAMLDRLTHRVHLVEANGESYRLRDSQRRLRRRRRRKAPATASDG